MRSRGLNPPHRVKAISMTTFTEREVQFLQSRGNEVCRKIWLGTFDSRTSLLPDSQDPQKVKEFLQEKYEKKKWYISPEQAKSLPSWTAQTSPAEAKALLGDAGPAAAVARPAQALDKAPPQLPQAAKKASMDLLADIGGDPFAAPPPGPTFPAFPAFGSQVPGPAAFASFDAFGGSPAAAAFGDTLASSHSPFQSQPMPAGGSHVSGFAASPASQPVMGVPDMGGTFRVGGVPSSVFGALSQSPVLPPPSPAPAYGACSNPFAAASQPALPSTNPFQTNGLAPGSPFSGFPRPRPPGQPVGISTNPFVTPMAAAPAGPFTVAKHPPTNPFL
ncbi:arf-GAP domain and FG repeat-containing protein 2 isoform X2 [Varanus komodoensis]|uniref:arf-GAP domain and FG repeat-containing protein 2 isoform X2 n=1 Tax=Varanus komodoensis TaxID=61221 RepID=UPI001CF7E042|nr:arf-GAP domain and FG repeat-containing protein 2 isoform X2 [Varanus komodoensis]